jgi:hypothetical protein
MKNTGSGVQPRPRRRGRPPKYGRPARLVAVTLPHDVIDWLSTIDPDVGRAIVCLHDDQHGRQAQPPHPERADAELVDVGEGRALIIVNPDLVRGLAGVAAIPFGSDRAFLALEPSATMADLELSVVDTLDRGRVDEPRKARLRHFRDLLRAWRVDRTISIDARAIIVVHRAGRKRQRGKTKTTHDNQ